MRGGRMAMGRTFGGEDLGFREELLPPPTPNSQRSNAEGPRCFVGVCSFQNQGKNGENQDSFIATENGTKSLVAVLDGHGEQGKRVSEYARIQLAKNLYASKELYSKPTMAMEHAFAETQKGIERSHAVDAHRSGTTAVACYRHRDRLVVANVGDSRAVLGRCPSRETGDARGLRAVDLSSDQRPMREDERSRILQQGGSVHQSAIPMRQGFGPPVLVRVGPERVWDKTGRCGLCVTRSLDVLELAFTPMHLDELCGPLRLTRKQAPAASPPANAVHCAACGEAFGSRNGLFKHLRLHGCGGATIRRQRRLLVFYGYVGTRFHGSQLNGNDDFPTVEAGLLRAFRSAELQRPHASRCHVEVCSRASRTDRGVHALASGVCVRITTDFQGPVTELGERSLADMVRQLLPPEITLVELIDIQDPEFNARFACQKREYWYYVPYDCLLLPEEQAIWSQLRASGGVNEEAWVWVSGLPEADAELRELRERVAGLLEVQMDSKEGSARLRFADSGAALRACEALDGALGPKDAGGGRGPLMALPEPLLQLLQRVHKRLRSCLKKLTGTFSFHNFTCGMAPNDPKSIRSVYRCRSGVTSGYTDFVTNRAFAVLRITGRDFLYHQIRGMAGAVVAAVSGLVPETYLELALSSEPVEVPKAPGGFLVLAECVFRTFAVCWGQGARERADKAAGRRGLPGPAAIKRQAAAVVEEMSRPELQEAFRDF
ncbi:unnamed protein product, partial [Effrenium voratum]